jgi:hypothetical protein
VNLRPSGSPQFSVGRNSTQALRRMNYFPGSPGVKNSCDTDLAGMSVTDSPAHTQPLLTWDGTVWPCLPGKAFFGFPGLIDFLGLPPQAKGKPRRNAEDA